MSWAFLIGTFILPTLAVCASLSQPQDTSDLSQGSVSPALSFSKNSSAATGNSTFGNILKLRCDTVRYGRNLNRASCSKAFNYLTADDKEISFAERGSIQPHDLNLPFRATSNDGRCYVQLVLADDAVTARATSKEVSNAAYTLFHECVFKHGMGGIAGDIGGDNQLNVIIASYKPYVRCNSFPGPPWNSCLSLFSDMHADKYRRVFGHLPDEKVQVQLPITYTAADQRCMVKIDIKGQPTGLSWYEVWEAIVALSSICVRGKQKSGKATGLGLGRNIFLQLSDEHPEKIIQPSSISGQNFSLLTKRLEHYETRPIA